MAKPRTGQPKDTEDAIRLAAEKLNRQAKEPNIYGYHPHEKQEIFHKSQARIRLYIGGNRSGKTTGGITEDVWWLRGDHPYRPVPPPPIRGRIVSVDFANGVEKIIIPNITKYLPIGDLRGGSWYTAYDRDTRTIHLENGSFVELMSYDQDLDKFAGTSRHFVHYDEEPPKPIYTECQTRLIDTGGSSWLTMTPVEGMTWVYDDLYEPGMKGNSHIFVLEIDMNDNPYIPQAEIQIYRQSLGADEDDINARIHGKFVQTGGLIFPIFKPDTHVIPRLEGIPAHWQVESSLDHGLNNPTAWLWHTVDPDNGRVITFHESYHKEWVIDQHSDEVHRIEEKEIKRTSLIRVGDPSIRARNPITGTSVLEEYQKKGVYINLGNNDVSAGLSRMKSMFSRILSDGKPAWMVTENCANFIWELQRYRWATYTNRTAFDHNVKETPVKKNDHACDSARYYIMSRPNLVIDTYNDPGSIPNPLNLPSVAADTPTAWGMTKQESNFIMGDKNTSRLIDESSWITDEMGADW